MNPLSMKISFTFVVRSQVHGAFQLCSSKNPLRNLRVINVPTWVPVCLLCGILYHICGISTSHCSLCIPLGAKLNCIDMMLELHKLMRIMSRLTSLREIRRCEHVDVMYIATSAFMETENLIVFPSYSSNSVLRGVTCCATRHLIWYSAQYKNAKFEPPTWPKWLHPLAHEIVSRFQ